MKDLEKYIRESIFDEEDNISTMDAFVEMKNWIKKLSKAKEYEKTLDDIEKVMTRNSYKITKSSEVKEGEYFITFYRNVDNPNFIQSGIYIFYPQARRGWKYVNINKAVVKDTVKDKYTQYLKNAINFSDFKYSVIDISNAANLFDANDSVYIFPEKYYKLIDLIREAPDRILF